MSSLTKKLLLFFSLCSLFLISWFLPRFLSPKHCINSSLVEKVVMYQVVNGESKQQQIESCSLKTLMQGEVEAGWANELKRFAHRIERLNSVESILSDQQKLPTVFIATHDPFAYVMSEDHIILGYEIAKAKGQLERAVFAYVLGYEKEDTKKAFIKEVLADVYLAIVDKELVVEDPFTGDRHDLSELYLHTSYRTFGDYCHWALKSFRHQLYCTYLNSTRSRPTQMSMSQPTFWSLRPLVSAILWRSIELSGLSGVKQMKLHSFKQVESRLAELDDLFELEIPHIPATKLWLEFMSVGTAKLLGHKMAYNAGALLESLREKYVTHVPQFEYKIKFMGPSQLGYRYTLPETKNSSHVIEFYNGSYLMHDFSYISQRFYLDFEYKKDLVVGCSLPEPEELLDMEIKQDELYFIRVCSPDNRISYTEIAKQGIENYLTRHASIEYIKFHMPVLNSVFTEVVAAKDEKTEALSPYDIVSWREIMNFDEAEWDEDIKAFRSMTDAGAVNAFRLHSMFQ